MIPIRVLVVDDSATMRGLISLALRRDPEIEVVGTASNPLTARDAIKTHNPDVITLDVEMPGMNGLDFLKKIVRLRPTPVIMVSNLTGAGTETAIEAMQIGAVDCIAKPAPGDLQPFAELPRIVKAAAGARVRPRSVLNADAKSRDQRRPFVATYEPDGRMLAIGSSTGGVEALSALISQLPENCPPTAIVQHMPPDFTASLAARLDRLNAPKVKEAYDGAPLETGCVYIAPGGTKHLEVEENHGLRCRLRAGPPVSGHSPSVDALFTSVAQVAKANAIGVILTGMGRDGAQGLLAMRQAGARTIGQDEATSLIYGMPRAAFEIGAVERQLPLDRIANAVLVMTNLRGRPGRENECHSQTS
ncbi:MAG: chemotaxis response regulator protein-glutamate methylesterase [Hyphomicrobium sp.]|uniref:protein-glutamate methylesterase/protein-glutamine glutaminase n=1 Tax=Hyphomicrobium sp. TaxID=82 RepID=UPI00132972AC|nr:chemotaxis response regulator protein-glutamate methylesterase [Hyphomicrobium sp.]KAB2943223.1 MAG: chemotaxis response regulator protein-glutamate methylesterase [Hyphomicrobium sp.]MBZ0210134.1 chemotaxis response regulator protein-glutamate methylesterase [Hyphomicrobium sp.]